MGIQQILSIGALALFTFMVLTFSSSSNIQYDTSNFNEAVITATGIAESLIEQIQKKTFDEHTVNKGLDSTDSLTSLDSLSFDKGEYSVNTFDDIDDFNGYTKIFSNKLGNFNTAIKVYYVSKLNPDIISSSPTFLKRFDIYVTNKYLEFIDGKIDTLVFSGIISY